MASKIGEGVHEAYKERAQKGGDILWHVKIKGQSELAEGIPLHMSLKVFEEKGEMKIEEIKRKIREFGIKKPNPKKLGFKTTIFAAERDGKEYYMLLLSNTDKSYEHFYDSMKHCGTVYKKFMPHITIDKLLYDKINQEGLKPEEVEFDDLSIESGAGNTVYEFKKSLGEEYLGVVRENAFFVSKLMDSPIVSMSDNTFKNWLNDNPNIEQEILKKHEERVTIHFGHDSALHQFALKNGIKKTYENLRKK